MFPLLNAITNLQFWTRQKIRKKSQSLARAYRVQLSYFNFDSFRIKNSTVRSDKLSRFVDLRHVHLKILFYQLSQAK